MFFFSLLNLKRLMQLVTSLKSIYAGAARKCFNTNFKTDHFPFFRLVDSAKLKNLVCEQPYRIRLNLCLPNLSFNVFTKF